MTYTTLYKLTAKNIIPGDVVEIGRQFAEPRRRARQGRRDENVVSREEFPDRPHRAVDGLGDKAP